MRFLILSLLLGLLLPATASAQTSRIMRDCVRNDGIVAGKHSFKSLRRAYRRVPRERRVADDCSQSIASHLAARRGLKGGRKAGTVLDNCTRHGGRLTLRFAPHALNRAAARMTAARREQTRCLVGIFSQLRARGRPVAVRRPDIDPAPGPYDDQTGEELADSLARFTGALRRAPVPEDAPTEDVRTLVQTSPEGFYMPSLRRIGPGEAAVWLVTADGRVCAIRSAAGTPEFACLAANRFARGRALLSVRSDGVTHDVWGAAPDAFHSGTLLFGEGDTSRPLFKSDNGILEPLDTLPGAIQWSAGGTRQWFDPTTVSCRRNCLTVPPIPGVG